MATRETRIEQAEIRQAGIGPAGARSGMTVRDFRWARDLLDAHDPLGALQVIEPSLREKADDPAVRELLARAYFDSAQLGRAEQVLRRIVGHDPGNAWARHALGRTLERGGRRAEAAGHLRLAAAMRPLPEYLAAARRHQRRGRDADTGQHADGATADGG